MSQWERHRILFDFTGLELDDLWLGSVAANEQTRGVYETLIAVGLPQPDSCPSRSGSRCIFADCGPGQRARVLDRQTCRRPHWLRPMSYRGNFFAADSGDMLVMSWRDVPKTCREHGERYAEPPRVAPGRDPLRRVPPRPQGVGDTLQPMSYLRHEYSVMVEGGSSIPPSDVPVAAFSPRDKIAGDILDGRCAGQPHDHG